MKPGDLARKERGRGIGEVGIIIKVITNSYDTKNAVTILEVLVEEEIKKWYSNYVEVIDEK